MRLFIDRPYSITAGTYKGSFVYFNKISRCGNWGFFHQNPNHEVRVHVKHVKEFNERSAENHEEHQQDLASTAMAYVDAENATRIEALKADLLARTAICEAELAAIRKGIRQPFWRRAARWGVIWGFVCAASVLFWAVFFMGWFH